MLKLNNKGSALVWVLTICIIFSLLGVAIGWIALSMNNRSVNNNLKQQTYFTARSAVDAVFEQLNGDPTEKASTKYLQDNLLAGEKKITITDMGFEKSMADSCEVHGTYNPEAKEVTLTGTAKKGAMEDTVILTAELSKAKNQNLWPNIRYGYTFSLIDSTNPTSPKLIGNIGEENSVYYVNKSIEKASPLSFSESNRHHAIFIYVKEGITLKINEIKNWETTKPDVFVYLANGSCLSFEGSKETEFPLYISGDTGSKVALKNAQEVKVYGLSGASVTDGTIENLKKTPKSGYGAIGKPAKDKESGMKADVWTKLKYTTDN
ncbi:MAG: hypothetical protein RSE20_10270 [Eubacterium sp.]